MKFCLLTLLSVALGFDFQTSKRKFEEGDNSLTFPDDETCLQSHGCYSLKADAIFVGEPWFDEPDVPKAVRMWQKSAEEGDNYAQYRLGLFYSGAFPNMYGENELGTDFSHLKMFERDFDRATTYLYASALQGNVMSLVTLANRHELGHGVRQSCDIAASYIGEVVRNISDSSSFGGAEHFQGFLAYRFSAAGFGDMSVIDSSSVDYAKEMAGAHVLDRLLSQNPKATGWDFYLAMKEYLGVQGSTAKVEEFFTGSQPKIDDEVLAVGSELTGFAHASDFVGRLLLLGVNEPQNVHRAYLHLEAAAFVYEEDVESLLKVVSSRFSLPSFAFRKVFS
eukprot:GDKJ01003904.1.p1 GENE.GDKJ01003904.1~~GDKJ01003904.1.p1  ORF type:complete len:336 (+),score=67.09 GDKJ01003904.1:31-1038(+)